MFTELAWVVLHGGGHDSGGVVSFEAALGGLVTLLVVVGALWYAGVLESLGSAGGGAEDAGVDAERDSGAGD